MAHASCTADQREVFLVSPNFADNQEAGGVYSATSLVTYGTTPDHPTVGEIAGISPFD